MIPTALITGASGGIGKEMARLFAKAGYHLIIVARSEEKLKQLQSELDGHQVTIIVQDLTEADAAKKVYENIRAAGRTVEVVINNAGFGLNGYFEDIPLEEQLEMLRINVHTLTALSHYFLKDMKNAPLRNIPRGIINVASTAAFQPGPKMAVYYASKAYVLSLSEALAVELRETGVTVTALCPGATATNFFKTARAEHTRLTNRTMTPSIVAKAGFLGFVKGKRIVIPGLRNQTGSLAAKFLPRSLAAKLALYMDSER
ncbi:SDR family NAD(P)-dependent oxidoreductase [Thalassobacillus pellis]|uniref:SDR family NAD(P)-dependent oxidoreductase n=1 Tax=Thalassobacillus pellis TaxID=748008 RepID=UPI00196177F2|nr:SDR family oxidoreductase [Thalassobacillus pellis]MBM7553748.1 short-subunit dehydrogenase [Thalassobacillus pellis]